MGRGGSREASCSFWTCLRTMNRKGTNPHPASAATLSHPMGEGLGVRAVHGKGSRLDPEGLLRDGDADHPTQAEAVGEHAEAWRPECLGQWHAHLAAGGQRSEGAVGLRCRWHGE